jgi:hypothetical protein
MIPATPGDTASEGWPGYFAEKAGTKTNLGTADAVMKDVQARETKNAPDQEFPPGETNPYLGWALWWRPSEGDAGIYGKKGGVETVHGTADAVALDIQNREKANQPQTPSGGVETYSGQDYLGWQLWSSTQPLSATGTPGAQQWFGVQGGTRTQLFADVQQLYLDIQNRSPQPQPTVDPYQPSPYQSPYQPSPYQSPYPMTGGGGSFTPSSGGGFGPSSGGYGEGGFLSPRGNSGMVNAADGGMPGADARESDALYPDDVSEEAEAEEFEDAEYEDAEYEDSDLDEAPRRSRAIDGLGATPSLPSAILPLAGVALLWYLVTRK